MKIFGSILTLCLVQPMASAFTVQPKVSSATALNSFSYGNVNGGNVNGGGPVNTNIQRSSTQTSPSSATSNSFSSAQINVQDSTTSSGGRLATWETSVPVIVQGGALKTWSFSDPAVERVQVLMRTEGRPLNSNIELWHGPDNTPQKMGVYLEDGNRRTFSAVILTPRGQNAVAIRNTGHLEFPLNACVEAETGEPGLGFIANNIDMGKSEIIQGGALKTYPFDPYVESVQLLLQTDGRPLNARIELLQGPNNDKQVIELYTEDGMERPFYMVIDTPGVGNVVRVVNTATVEFPLTARVEAYSSSK